jgi:hypothetical protein
MLFARLGHANSFSQMPPKKNFVSKFALARFTALAVATLLLGFVCFAQETASSAGVTAIRAGRLVDVDAGRVPTNQVIVVRDGKIESIAGNASIPASAAVIDLSNSAADLLGKSDLLGSMHPRTSSLSMATRRPTSTRSSMWSFVRKQGTVYKDEK